MNADAQTVIPEVAGSHTRARALVLKACGLQTPVFWPVFLETWCGCDCIWPDKAWLLDMLLRPSPPATAIIPKAYVFAVQTDRQEARGDPRSPSVAVDQD